MEQSSTANGRRELSSDYNTLELTMGKSTSLMDLSDNEISTNSYLSNSVFLRLLFKLLNPCPLSLMMTILTAFLLPQSTAYPRWMYLTQFGLVLILIIFKEVYFDLMRRRADDKVNQSCFLMKDSKIYRDGEEIQDVCWGQIRQGDILYLQKGEKAPADVLVLDTQYIQDRQAVVYVDARSITGRVTVQRKKACYLTQVTSRSAVKRTWDKYKKQYLTGKLKYQLPNANMQDFIGYLKLVKDPKTSLITFENFISRQSIIKTCWVYGLVINAGMNCKIMRHIGERNRNHKFFENNIDRIFVACIIINLMFGLPYALLALAGEYYHALSTVAYHFILFSVGLPIFLYIGNGLLLLYFSFKNSLEAQIINYSSIISLGSIDYAVMAYNGVLNSGKMIADQIITASSFYDFRQELTYAHVRGSRRMASINDKQKPESGYKMKNSRNKFFVSIYNSGLSTPNTPALLNNQDRPKNNQYDPYHIDDDYRLDTNGRMFVSSQPVANTSKYPVQLQPLIINRQKLTLNIMNDQQQSIQLIKAYSICHQAILKSVDSQDIKFQANSRVYSQQVLLKLVNGIGVHVSSQIQPRSKKQIGLRIKIQDKDRQWFYSRRLNTFSQDKKVFSVVVKEQRSEQKILYCKGNPTDMLEKLKDQQIKKNIIDSKLAQFKNSKAQILIYGKRTMSSSQYELYDAEFTKLKMSSNVTDKDLDNFSTTFEKDLEFVCMIGLSSERSQAAKEMSEYLIEKGIKMCVFAHNMSQIQSLKTLLADNDKNKKIEYVQFQGITMQQITYNLNSITRKLNSEKQYVFSMIIGPKCWNLLSLHQNLMQHFLFAVYYSFNILTYGLTSQVKAEFTKKLKTSFNKQQTILTIGSSYSDLLFENYSDVSLIISSCEGQSIHSDIPSDIRAPTIASLKNIIQLGSWVTSAYNNIIQTSVYRSLNILVIAFVIQTYVFASHRTSYNLDGVLTAFYIVFYGALETLFTIKIEQKKSKIQRQQKIADQQARIRFIINIVEALLHGVTISIVVLLTLPHARLQGGKLFPVQAIHFSIYFLLVTVSVFRHAISRNCSKTATLILALITLPLMLGLLWLVPVFDPYFYRCAIQMIMIWQSYDSAIMIVNVIVFSLACSLFLAEIRRKGMIGILAEYYLNLKKAGAKSRQLLEKNIQAMELIKHLFRDEDSIQESIQDLVGSEFDTNQLKISPFLQIKKTQHRIKNQFNNVPLNVSRFRLLLIVICLWAISQIVLHGIATPLIAAKLIPLDFSVLFLVIGLIYFIRYGEDIGRKYYSVSEIVLVVFFILIVIYMVINGQKEEFQLTCLSFIILTQLIGIRLQTVLFLSIACLITGISVACIEQQYSTSLLVLQVLFMCLCAAFNVAILYGTTLESRKNFILRQQIQMQTNQTNDIWTILVPQFVRNFFSQNGEQGGQYKQNSVAILFCYVCQFDSILEQQGRNVVRMLDDLYRQFDRLCSSFAVQKIETVGYTYMAASGIRKIQNQMQNQMVRKNKVERLMGMAQQMLEKVKLFKWGLKKNKDLQIKIGIHVGQVVVGVIGKHKKQFSLIGTNVNTTSRHGSTGSNNTITMSRQARAELHNVPDQAFIRRQVWMKGLCETQDDTIPVYQLKIEEAARRTNKASALKIKFKELVMKIIRTNRITNDSSDDEQLMGNFVNKKQQQEAPNRSRQGRRRTTCRGLENNFTKIQEMKNRQDELKCYSKFLQFDQELARQHFTYTFPTKTAEDIQQLVEKQTQTQDAYSLHLQSNRACRNKIFIIGLLATTGIYLYINLHIFHSTSAQVVLRSISLLLILVLFWLIKHFHSSPAINWIVLGIFIYLIIIQRIDEITDSEPTNPSFTFFYTVMVFTIFSGISGVKFLQIVIMGIIIIVMSILTAAVSAHFGMTKFYQWFYVLLVSIRKYQFQKQSIINFRQGKKTVQLSNQLSKIVSQLLPKHAYQKLKTQNFQNRLQLTDLFQQCTILFADIKGFTQFSDRPQNRKQPQNVVRMLRLFFQEFDALCTDLNVYKVYTIGDCYVVLGFTNCYQRNPVRQAGNVVSFAFEMLKTIQKVKKERPSLSCLNMRIGIHTGTIIGGIVGTQIVRYDIYGSDVVVANKFEEKGKINEIHISQQTKKLLDQLQKKPYSENNIYASQKVEVKKLNVTYNAYFIKRGNLS